MLLDISSDWKEECVLETGLCLVFYPAQNLHLMTSSESNGNENNQKQLFLRHLPGCLFSRS